VKRCKTYHNRASQPPIVHQLEMSCSVVDECRVTQLSTDLSPDLMFAWCHSPLKSRRVTRRRWWRETSGYNCQGGQGATSITDLVDEKETSRSCCLSIEA
jgi:hypothetical protein